MNYSDYSILLCRINLDCEFFLKMYCYYVLLGCLMKDSDISFFLSFLYCFR